MRKTQNTFRKTKNRKTRKNKTKKTKGGSSPYGGGFRPKGYPQIPPVQPPAAQPPVVQPLMQPPAIPSPYGVGMQRPGSSPYGGTMPTPWKNQGAASVAPPVASVQEAVQAAFQAGAALATASPVAGAAIAASPVLPAYSGGMTKPPMRFDSASAPLYDLPPRPPQMGRQPTVSSQLYEDLLNPDNLVLFNEALFQNVQSFEIQDERGNPHKFTETSATGHYVTFHEKPYSSITSTHLTIHKPSLRHGGSRIGALHIRFNHESLDQEWPYRRILLYDNGQEITIEIDRNGYNGSEQNNVIIDRITNEAVNAIIYYYTSKGKRIRRL